MLLIPRIISLLPTYFIRLPRLLANNFYLSYMRSARSKRQYVNRHIRLSMSHNYSYLMALHRCHRFMLRYFRVHLLVFILPVAVLIDRTARFLGFLEICVFLYILTVYILHPSPITVYIFRTIHSLCDPPKPLHILSTISPHAV